MANRVLKRPMFRMGGSPNFEFQEKTSGILSGLDGPKLNASRTGMANGGTFEEGVMERMQTKQNIRDKLGLVDEKGGMPGSISSALMNFGINLLAQPGGSLTQAIGKAGSPALQQFQAARQRELDRKRSQKEGDLSDAFETEASFREVLEKYKDEDGNIRDPFKFEEEVKQIRSVSADTNTKTKRNKDIDSEIADIQNNPRIDDKRKIKLVGELEDEKNSNTQDIIINQKVLEKIQGRDPRLLMLEETIIEEKGFGSEEHLEFLKKNNMSLKDGGRVKLQQGGTPLMEEVVETVEEEGDTSAVEDLTYTELRARLPGEITNDVVSLIANSKQALLDFANIRTQQDVDNFNTSYNVNLILPQEG